MDDILSIRCLVAALGTLYSAEGRAGADAASIAARNSQDQEINPHTRINDELLGQCATILQDEQYPLSQLLARCLPLLNWYCAGLEDGRIRPEIAQNMLTSELIGPTGLFYNDTVRMGLFIQSANLNYVTRSHLAEETFVMLAGSGNWSTNDGPANRQIAGDFIHHPSDMPHACYTEATPLIAAWRWSGDIGWDSYALKG